MRRQDDDRKAKKYRVEMVMKNLGMPDWEREKEILSRIVMSPGVYDGAPTLRDPEVPVEFVLHLLGRGHPESEVRNLLDLSEEDLQAVFLYAGTLAEGTRRTRTLSDRKIGIAVDPTRHEMSRGTLKNSKVEPRFGTEDPQYPIFYHGWKSRTGTGRDGGGNKGWDPRAVYMSSVVMHLNNPRWIRLV